MDIANDLSYIQRVREYYEQLYRAINGSLDYTDNYPEKWELHNSLNTKYIIWITPEPLKKLNLQIKNPKWKSPSSHCFAGESYQVFKELIPILHSLFQKTEKRQTFLNLFYEA